MKKVIKYLYISLWSLFIFSILGCVLLFYMASEGYLGDLPSFEQIENPKTSLASEIISFDREVIGAYFRENRSRIHYEELSPYLIDGLISTEDERFRDHSGIDIKSLLRAMIKFGKEGGASTITQQLAKMLFTKRPSRSVIKRLEQKIKEWVIAVRLERQYTKNEIITMYFNKFDFLYQAVGIKSATRTYFDKLPKDINIQEAATLVGMAKNPSLYNPVRYYNRSIKRRNIVLSQMYRNDKISKTELDSIKQLPIELNFKQNNHNQGIATYFREYLRLELDKWLKTKTKPNGETYNLYKDGLKIYVTIDSRMQRYAEKAVKDHLSNLQRIFFEMQKNNKTAPFVDITKEEERDILKSAMKRTDRYKRLKAINTSEEEIEKIFNASVKMKVFAWNGDIDTIMSPMDSIVYYKHFLQTGVMSMEPQTGFVKVWVGGINHEYFKYDHVKRGTRQVGSTFKPFVYATAINQLGLSPCYQLPNTRVTFEKEQWGIMDDWSPKNTDDRYGGMIDLKTALAKSKNAISARLMKMVGPKPIVDLVKKMGVESHIPVQPSICLGSADISLYEMVGAYATFANKGVYTKPILITKIEDKNGVILDRFVTENKEVMSEQVAYAMLKLMQGVTTSGTGVRLKLEKGAYPFDCVTGFPYGFDNPIAGKTGTTNNHSDGWFAGIVPNLVTSVWVGNEDRSAHFRNIVFGQGATMALPIWALFMKQCYANEILSISKEDFEVPKKGNMIPVDCDKYKYNIDEEEY